MRKYLKNMRTFAAKNVSIPVLLALVLVGGVAEAKTLYAKNARKAHQDETLWGVIQGTTPTFVDLTGVTEDNSAHPASGTYSCTASSNICSGYSSSTPTNTGDLDDTNTGDFRQN